RTRSLGRPDNFTKAMDIGSKGEPFRTPEENRGALGGQVARSGTSRPPEELPRRASCKKKRTLLRGPVGIHPNCAPSVVNESASATRRQHRNPSPRALFFAPGVSRARLRPALRRRALGWGAPGLQRNASHGMNPRSDGDGDLSFRSLHQIGLECQLRRLAEAGAEAAPPDEAIQRAASALPDRARIQGLLAPVG